MRGSTISVIIPTLNSEEYIEKSIRSIMNQTYENIEIIVIDDGSSDSTVDIVKNLSHKGNIKLIERESSGIPSARNRGISEASGEYIANQDADDISNEKRLEIQMKNLNERNLDLVGSGTYDIDGSDDILFRRNVVESINRSDIREGAPIIHGTCLMKKDKIEDIDGYDENFPVSEDKDLWIRLDRNGCKLGNVDLPLYQFRRHGDSTYASNLRKAKIYGRISVLRSDGRISNRIFDDDDIKFDDIKSNLTEEEIRNYYIELSQEFLRYGMKISARRCAKNAIKHGGYTNSIGVIGLSFMPKKIRNSAIRTYRLKVHNKSIKNRNSHH